MWILECYKLGVLMCLRGLGTALHDGSPADWVLYPPLLLVLFFYLNVSIA